MIWEVEPMPEPEPEPGEVMDRAGEEGAPVPEPEPESESVTVSGCGEGMAAAELEPGTVTVRGCGDGLDAVEPEPGEPGELGVKGPYGEICGPTVAPDGATWLPVADKGIVSVPVKPEKPGPDGTV